MIYTKNDRKSAYDSAGFLSKLFFAWVTPIFVKVINRKLLENEIFSLSKSDTAAHLMKIFQKEWDNELRNLKPNLMKSICRIFWKKYLLLGVLLLFENCLNLSQPIIVWKLLTYSKTINETLTEVLILALLLVFTIILLVLIRNSYYFHTLKMGMQLKIGIGGVFYQKILKLNQKALSQTTTGQIVNLMSNDIQKFEFSLPHLHYIWLGPLVTIISVFILYFFSREGGLASILVIFILIPTQISLGKLYNKFRFFSATITDDRIKIISELVNGMQVVKMYCWEPMFIKIISDLRRKALLYGFIRKLAKALWVTLRFTGGRLIMISFLTAAFMFQIPLSSQVVWLTVILVNQIRGSIVDRFSLGITNLMDLCLACSRIQKFLFLSEFKKENVVISNLSFPLMDSPSNKKKSISVTFENVYAKWNENVPNEYALRNISFSLTSPQICAIIGEVGSGKSSIFMALLGELPISEGRIFCNGTLIYTTQQPWIFSGSVLENILFDHSLHKENYKNILKATALDKDIERMPSKDLTVVGERGVLLSGGQKSRISLARTAYSSGDIILLDDPFASVDATVGYQIFTECISGLFKEKLIFLITHQLHLLKNVDKIIVLNGGNLIAFGTYDEIISEGVNLQSIIKQEITDDIIQKTNERTNRDTTEINEFEENTENNYNNQSNNIEQNVPLLFRVISRETITNSSKLYHLSKQDKLEEFSTKNVRFNLYWKYFTAGCSSFTVLMMFSLYIGTMFLYVFCDIWLSWWTKEMDKRNTTSLDFYNNDRNYLIGFAIFSLFTFVGSLLSVMSLFMICIYSCKALHEQMLKSILFSPMSFFHANSSGRILNRFSKDVSTSDDLLPITLQDFLLTCFLVVFGLGLALFKNYWAIIIISILLVIFWFLRKSHINVSSSIKRIEAATRSPLYSHISTTLHGLTTIRAFKSEEWFIEEFQIKQDRHSKALFSRISTNRWFSFRLDEVCVVFIVTIVYSSIALLYYEKINTSDFGLLLSYIISLIGLTQWAVRQSIGVENQMTSIERIYEYIDLPSEYLKLSGQVDEDFLQWPETGKIEYKNVSLCYEKSGPYVLNNINLVIEDKEKIGIVGRTGAGKSSLISLLFRLIEIQRGCGEIYIDDVDISVLGLRKLRTAISVIPQDPVLFMGTIRMNLDPFNEFVDQEIFNVLESVELLDTIIRLPDKLNSLVSEGGSNLSVGQRQLVCIARALLKKTRIIVIDEATANVDQHTDNLIQKTLKTTFANCTVLTIAHRLSTIMDCDKIIVMNDGQIEQFDHPYNLFNSSPNTIFNGLVQQIGSCEENKLRRIAEINFLNRKNKL